MNVQGLKSLGSIVPAVIPIYPDPVPAAMQVWIDSFQAAQQPQGGSGVSGLGCTNQNVCWDYASMPNNPWAQQGRDVLWQDTGLNGLEGVGDFVPGRFPVPQNPIAGNALGRQLAGLRGIDVSSLANFEQSLTTGTSFGLPNLVVVGGALVLAALLFGGSGGGGRRH